MTRQAWQRTVAALVEAAVLWVAGFPAAALVCALLLASIEPRRAYLPQLVGLAPSPRRGRVETGSACETRTRLHAKAHGAHR